MISPVVTTRLIRAFEGWRHDRLRDIWQVIAEYVAPYVRVEWFANPGAILPHADAFQRIWLEERDRDPRFLLLTEEDFLPNLSAGWKNWTGLSYLVKSDADALFLPYQTRDPARKSLLHHRGLSAGWYVALDKNRVPKKLCFRGDPDPCNQLCRDIKAEKGNPIMIAGVDCRPIHYGIEYPVGTHLFWSRHLHDDPCGRVSGFRLGDVQRRHDHAVTLWIAAQPEAFRRLLAKRAPNATDHRLQESRSYAPSSSAS